MSADPLLVLQLQRMGDLILTFPLLGALRRRWPEHPIWVVAEPQFFQTLMPLAPEAIFFPPEHCEALTGRHYCLAINLSARPEAVHCLAKLTAEQKLGPAALPSGLYVYGQWQLYRATLTQNNHLNAFHWADLHLLDLESPNGTALAGFVPPRGAGRGRVALVLGASDASKRPDVDFWARLARRLAREGTPPLLLGGPAERELGEAVARLAGLPQANFCGRLSLQELAECMRSLDLCITPDTGPMHLANWLGVPVLNLSMGPVHARETGPLSPGQWVLRAAMSCIGCWHCHRNRFYCKQAFTPQAVAHIALALLQNPGCQDASCLPGAPGLELYRVGRDALGLHSLSAVNPRHAPSCRPLLEDFWQAAFLYLDQATLHASTQERLAPEHRVLERLNRLRLAFPALSQRMCAGLARICAQCAAQLKNGGSPLPSHFWRGQVPALRLFSGHLHMLLQNANYSPQGWQEALERLTRISALWDKT